MFVSEYKVSGDIERIFNAAIEQVAAECCGSLGTKYLLKGIVIAGSNKAADILYNCGIGLQEILTAFRPFLGLTKENCGSCLSPDASIVLDMALDISFAKGKKSLDSIDLLLALIRAQDYDIGSLLVKLSNNKLANADELIAILDSI